METARPVGIAAAGSRDPVEEAVKAPRQRERHDEGAERRVAGKRKAARDRRPRLDHRHAALAEHGDEISGALKRLVVLREDEHREFLPR